MEQQLPQQFYQHDVQSVVDWFVPLDDGSNCSKSPSSSFATQAVTMNVNLDASGMTAAVLENCLSVTTLCTRWAVSITEEEKEEQHPRPPQRIVSRVYAARVLQAALLQMASTSATTDTATTVSIQKHCDVTQCRVVTSSIVTNQTSITLHQNKDAPNKVVVDNNNNDDDANDDDANDEAITIPCTSK
jgi:hypothetical protein